MLLYKNQLTLVFSLAAMFLLPPPSYADKSPIPEQIKQRLSKLSGQSADTFNIHPSELKGFFYFEAHNNFGLISQDAKYLIQGDLINIETGANLTSKLRHANNLNIINQIPRKIFISYQADQEKSKVWVFSDVDCFFCQKFHREIQSLNNLGITVNYISFPRSGQSNGDDWVRARKVWCAKDRKRAMDIAKRRQSVSTIPQQTNCDPQISLQYASGKAVGVTGTPTIVLETGEATTGYIPAKELAKLTQTE